MKVRRYESILMTQIEVLIVFGFVGHSKTVTREIMKVNRKGSWARESEDVLNERSFGAIKGSLSSNTRLITI